MDVRRQANDNNFADVPAAPRREVASNGSSSSSMISKVLAILLIAVSVAVLGWFGNKAYAAAMADSSVKTKQFQAVFLTNGQVYFGKVSKVDNSYVELQNIYYLQVQQTVQPKDSSTTAANNQQVSLAKLGGELHGPEDVMYISRQQVLFWENLKDSGKVVQAIKNYQSSGGK